MSFALATRDVSAYYGQEADPAYKYAVSTIEDTHVELTDQGYQIQLYDYQFFGCGPHYTYDIDMLVTVQGDVEQISAKSIFRDPDEDNLCVD